MEKIVNYHLRKIFFMTFYFSGFWNSNEVLLNIRIDAHRIYKHGRWTYLGQVLMDLTVGRDSAPDIICFSKLHSSNVPTLSS